MHRPLTIFVSHPSDFITDHRVHGDGQIAFDLLQRLAGRGHKIHVAYTSADLSKPLHPNVELHKIVCRFPSSRVQELEYMVRVRQLFRRLHRTRPFDLIHQFHPVFFGRSALLTNIGIPLVLGVFYARWPAGAESMPQPLPWHSWLTAVLLCPFIQFADRWQQRYATALLLSTPAAASCLYNPGREGPRCNLIWCPGVDVDYYKPTEAGEPLRPLTALFLGNLERRKGIFVLAESFRRVWRQRPDARLVFVGTGTQRDALRQYVEEDESKINVEFRGELRGADKKFALLSADLIVMPSFGEPHGLVALEAMASAKPMIATRAGGLQHLVPPEGGRLVPPDDASALAEAILDLLSQPELLPIMGEFNRRLAEERFAWPKVIDRLEEIYDAVIRDRISRTV